MKKSKQDVTLDIGLPMQLREVMASTRAAEAEQGADAGQTEGILEQAPISWLFQLVQVLPPAEKKSLFSCTRYFARLVCEAAGQVTLVLLDVQQTPADKTQARRSIIMELLRVRREFAVHLRPGAWQSFPMGLADRASALCLDFEHAVDPVHLPWAALLNLHTLHMNDTYNDDDLLVVCQAAEAGQLQNVRKLQFDHWHHEQQPLVRLLDALGPRLEELTTSSWQVATKISKLPALRSLTFLKCSVTADMFLPLLKHSTLRRLTLVACELDADYSHLTCSWDLLMLQDADISELQYLPLEGVQQVILEGQVWNSGAGSRTAVRQALDRHVHKIICRPALSCMDLWNRWSPLVQHTYLPCCGCSPQQFIFSDPCEPMTRLLKRMQGVNRLDIKGRVSSQVGMSTVWQALPLSVSMIHFHRTSKAEWARLWEGLPQHVTNITFDHCYITLHRLRILIRTAPIHVVTVTVACIDAELSALIADGVQNEAPKHLELVLLPLEGGETLD